MQLKSYRAATIQEAIELIRRDLGPDAAVLHAREAPRRGLARWFGRRLIEVTASPDANVPSRFQQRTAAQRPNILTRSVSEGRSREHVGVTAGVPR
jgi:flagellar biosynthesis GTPase FlhF